MAASGYTPISLYYSTTASAVPTAGNLANGELALNIADMKLYAKNSSGTVTLLASNASTTGVDSLSFGSTGLTPSTATTGAITVAGTLATTNGGTGLTSFTSGGVVYASSTSALATGSALTFDGTTFKVAKAGGVFGPTNLVYVDVTSSYGGVTLNSASGQNCFFELYQGGTTKVGEFGIDAANSLVNIGGFGSYNTRFYASGSEQMRLTSTGLGIGTSSPAYKLDVNGSANITSYLRIGSTPATGGDIRLPNTGIIAGRNAANSSNRVMLQLDSSDSVLLQEGSVTINSAGNLGLGTAPSNAYTDSRSFEIGANGIFWSEKTLSVYNSLGIGLNFYYNAAGDVKYKSTGVAASRYSQYQGSHIWYNAPVNSGAAGAAVTFTQAMTLDASGNLGVGTTSPAAKLDVRLAASNGGDVINIGNINGSVYGGLGIVAASPYSVELFGTVLTFRTGGNTTGSSTERARISSAGGFSVGTTADPGAGAIYATGNITAYYSDDRLKTRLGNIENALDKVDQLQGFYYEANETAQALGYKVKREVGVSAQSVQAVLPEIVSPAPIDQQYLTVDYERLVPLLIEAVKELTAKVKALEAK